MAVNQKLTHVVKDRVVQNFQLNPSELQISFVDGSTMKVRILESNSPPLREGARFARSPRIKRSFYSSVKTTVRSTQPWSIAVTLSVFGTRTIRSSISAEGVQISLTTPFGSLSSRNLALRLRYRRGRLRYAQYSPKLLARNLLRKLHKQKIVIL
jgi:hypothetical protein